VDHIEIFIFKLVAIDALSSSAIEIGKIAPPIVRVVEKKRRRRNIIRTIADELFSGTVFTA